MMKSTTIEELQWLHDSDVFKIECDTSQNSGWSISLTMHGHPDSGYAPWEGRHLIVKAIRIMASRHTVFSVQGTETFDDINSGVSSEFRERVLKGMSADTRFNIEFTMTFISGSVLEVICQELQVFDLGECLRTRGMPS